MTRPVVASIDLLALRQNLQIVRRAAPGSRLWAVVKANAYGHGVARVWSALSAADGFALLNLGRGDPAAGAGLERPDPAAGGLLPCR